MAYVANVADDGEQPQRGPRFAVMVSVRPYLGEFRRLQSIARAVGPNPHRWGIDPHLRRGVLVADLFVAAMVVVGVVLRALGAPLWFFPLFALPVLAFGLALLIVVSAQSRDEERVAEARKKR